MNKICDENNCVLSISKSYEDYLKDEHFLNSSFKDINDLYENKESFIVLYSAKGCPWCEELLPILVDFIEFKDLKIHYVKCWNLIDAEKRIRDDFRRKDNLEYLKNLEKISFKVGKGIGIPCMVKVVDGEVKKVHSGTVDSHDAHERKINEEEIKELKEILKDFFE